MRSLLLLVACAVALAGCATDNGANPGSGNNSTSTGTCAPKAILTEDHTFTDAPGGPAVAAVKIDAGCTTLTLNVTFNNVQGAPAGVASAVSVKLGTATCTLGDGPNTGPIKCGPKPTPAAGVKQVEYAGSGTITAHVVVTES
jgi:hypothetical protein